MLSLLHPIHPYSSVNQSVGVGILYPEHLKRYLLKLDLGQTHEFDV
jgi:hypothetical protein